MSPMQQIFLGLGAVATKTYVDDIFSTFLYTGTGSSGKQIVNNIDLSNEGGMVWLKNRSSTGSNTILDTVRTNGFDKSLYTDTSGSEVSGWSSTANSNGFTLGQGYTNINGSGETYASWSFRKAPGFFDVVTYTGNGTNGHQIAHNLGSIPGMILIKNLDTTDNWVVGHCKLADTDPWDHQLQLNTTGAAVNDTRFADTPPTSTHFTVGASDGENKNSSNIVAYVFAGGESTAATARSVEFDTNDSLSLGSTSDFSFPSDFTVEFWALTDSYSNSPYFCDFRDNGSDTGTTNRIVFYTPGNTGKPTFWLNGSARITASNPTTLGTWSHYALVRSGSTTTMYINGIAQGTYSDSTSYGNAPLMIGQRQYSSVTQAFDGKISNFRIVKGTAVYTSSFRPPTEPLTNITNTKLLCCNNSSTTGSTVTPGTITANGDPTALTDSPFDDPAGFVFGESGSENVIKCGSYVGNGSSTGPEINLGWEPSWVMVKRTDSSNNWDILDSMRGFVSGDDDARLNPDLNYNEYQVQRAYLTPTGFGIESTSSAWNADGGNYVYIAIRRSDGYVGKPVELGTGVFAQAYGANSGDFRFTSNFPVDFAWAKLYAGSGNWWTSARLIQGREVKTNNNDAEQAGTNKQFDSNVSWHAPNADNTYISHMWKRHAGFDVVTWVGKNIQPGVIPHSLGKVPEMMWLRGRSSSDWEVYHKGLNGGSSPETYSIKLNEADAEINVSRWYSTSPTSTHFTVTKNYFNVSNENYIGMLFASVSGVSAVGYYDGSSSAQTITTGFQPRFLLVKQINGANWWLILDTTRGWGSGNDQYLSPNVTNAQASYDFGAPTSNGFSVPGVGNAAINASGSSYIYYAHA